MRHQIQEFKVQIGFELCFIDYHKSFIDKATDNYCIGVTQGTRGMFPSDTFDLGLWARLYISDVGSTLDRNYLT